MAITITEPNDKVTLMAPQLLRIREAVLGSFFVKLNPTNLPHPSQIDTDSAGQKKRYEQYTLEAEFPEFTNATLVSMIGKMKINDTKIELNSGLEYLIDDSDGDGLSMEGLIESCARNVPQVGWHILLADYKGLTDSDLTSLSVDDVRAENTRATINQYNRENVIDWAYARVNGRMQLIYILLRENGEQVDITTGEHTTVESYIKLWLDDEGYNQQKITATDEGGTQEGQIYPISVEGERLRFIPISIASDHELVAGRMPLDTGYLTAIADRAYYEYNVSAKYKEALSSLLPTMWVSGMSDNDWKEFIEVNGRDYLASGPKCPNVLGPADAAIHLLETSASLKQFEDYFDRNEKKVRALGGVNDTESKGQRSVAEIINETRTQTDVIEPTVNSIEGAVSEQVLYCGMFEGIYSVKDLQKNMDDVLIVMPRDFAIAQLSVEESKELREAVMSGNISQDEYLRAMELGGRLVGDTEKIKNEIANSGPNITDIG